ncbi:MAG: clpP2 [Mucilaginibacter sp.]|nr:clpP2 [Mucilaginibacter sp.]
MNYKIYLYDTDTDCIGSGSLSSSFIQSQLEAAAGQDLEVHISSVGGSAFDAIAIYDLLKKYPGNVTTYVDALAASAASIVAMGGKIVVMSKYALLMIHKPMVGSGGNADELLKDVQRNYPWRNRRPGKKLAPCKITGYLNRAQAGRQLRRVN